MKPSQKNSFLTYILEKLEPYGPIRVQAMFGGYALYKDALQFASVYRDVLYFRVDEETIADYEAYSAPRFIFSGGGKVIPLPYFSLPEEILHNPKKLKIWLEHACQATIRAKLKKNHKK